jgi:hypothetical protein
VGPGGGNWANGANWSPTGVPPITSDLLFNGSSSSVVDTFVLIGTLNTGGSGAIAISSSGAFGVSLLNGINQVSGSTLNISAPITVNQPQVWTFSTPGTNNFTGNIGTQPFTIAGNGTLVLSGNNNFTSSFVNSGTLQATTSTALGTGTVTLSGGTLSLNSATNLVMPVSVVATTTSTLNVQGGGAHSVANLTVNGGVALAFTGGSTLTVSGTLTGSGTATGSVTLIDPGGGNVTPGTAGAGSLTIGALSLAPTTNLNYTVGSPTTLLIVNSPLTVNGVVNIAGTTPPAQGTYTLIQGPALTTGTVTLGTVPTGASYGLIISSTQMQLIVGPAPTAVGMAQQSAVSDGHSSYVTWKTGFETQNLGYRVYRQEGASRRLLTPGLIAGSALRATADLKVGHSYAWLDSASPRGGTYWIEAIDLNGKSEMFGPLSTHFGTTPTRGSSPLFSEAGRSTTALGPKNSIVHVKSGEFPREPQDLSQQWRNASASAAKLLVRDAGVYRVAAEQLFASGIPSGTDVSELGLWTSGNPVAFRAFTADGVHLAPGDAIEFYGYGIDTRYSDTRLYWVTVGSQARALAQAPTATPSTASASSFSETLEIRERLYYFSAVKNGGAEKFFGPQVVSSGLTRTFPTPALDVSSSVAGTLQVVVQGLSAGSHTVLVSLNGVPLGKLTGVDRNLMSATFAVPAGTLIAGNNTSVLAVQADTDIDVESYQQLSYPRRYSGLGAALQFTAVGGSAVHLEDFDAQTTRVFDITVPDAAVELTVSRDSVNQSGSIVNIPSSDGSHTLFAFRASDELTPLSVQSDVPSSWHSSSGAELVIIGHESLLPAVQPLVEQRQREGLSVATIDVQDIYDEFSYGEKDAAAIGAFLQFAAKNWSVAPRYVLLVGGATYDPRDYLGNPGLDLVPTNLIETVFLETGSDGAFVDFSVHGSTGIAIGRWPVTSPTDAALITNKTLNRAVLTSNSSLLLVHDADGTSSFSQATAQVRSTLSAWPVKEIARGSGTDSAVHDEVIASMRGGPAVVDYQGHGAEDFWNGNILSDEDTPGLANAGSTLLFSAATCFNGYFVDIGRTSLAQAMLLTENGGAWAAWASSGMTSPVEHSQLSSDLLEGTLVNGMTLGEASVSARSAVQDPDVRNTFHLFGDPSARMRPARTSSINGPSGIQSRVASGCGTPGTTAVALIPIILLSLVLAARTRRHAAARVHRESR